MMMVGNNVYYSILLFPLILLFITPSVFAETISFSETHFGASVTLPCASLTNSIDGCTIISGSILHDSTSLILNIETDKTKPTGLLDIAIPRIALDSISDTVDSSFFVFVDGEHVKYTEITSSPDYRTLNIVIPPGSTEVEIIGTMSIPEFPIAALMIIVALSIAVIISRFSKINVFQLDKIYPKNS